MKKEVFASLIVLLLIVMALGGCTDENIDNVDETNGTVDENGGEAEAANWTFEGLRISGEFVDPEAFQLPDDSYAMHLTGLGKVAYSPYGLTWTISEDDVIGEASSILKLPDGGYRAWWSVPKGAETFDMLTAFSNDGYNWEDETMLTSPNMDDFYGGMPAVVISPDGTYRMYYTHTGPDTFIKSDMPGVELHIKRVYSAHSSDGLVWEPDPGIRIDGGEEADKGHASSGDVYIRKDGKYEMVYCSGGYGIGWAVSDDGLSWTRMGSTGMDGADPVVNVFSDGTVRMYYAVYIPESKKQDVVGSDIVAGIYSATRETIVDGEGQLSSDFTPPSGAAPQSTWLGESGPWNQRVMVATSSDGLSWTRTNQILSDQASVPDALVDSRGWIFVYWNTWYEPCRDKIVVAINTGCENWANTNWAYKVATISGIPSEWLGEAVDPKCVQLDNGSFRLYFTHDSGDGARTYSAISSDGINFTLEEGVRSTIPGEQWVLDPTTLFIDNTWHLYNAGGINRHATSSDGLSFTRQDDITGTGMFSNGLKIDGEYRMYTFKDTSIYAYQTTDGYTFTSEGITLTADPASGYESDSVFEAAVVKLSDDSYVMFYGTLIPG